ncbi:hypothetical protein [uncultured Thiocystis sp.]|uniref:carboxylate--amine ligase n=1 Tax=uncultured Thiocystis sp. TaxID=1202134 RepID=UPI0025CE121A|nr:hypothetical protein [uncultured Thiocystis sp.]
MSEPQERNREAARSSRGNAMLPWRANQENATAVVFGLFETGLGVIRSLGQQGVKVYGIDYKKDIGWYSRYSKPLHCPDPLRQEQSFLDWIQENFSDWSLKPAAFFTSDDFLISFSRNRNLLSKHFVFNLAEHDLIQCIADKHCQFQIATKAGVNVPATWPITKAADLDTLPDTMLYPAFIKGQDVNSWRRVMGGAIKGFQVENDHDLREKIAPILRNDVPVILQEVIAGPDTNHLKYCSYTSSDGKIFAEFTLRKIRQYPVRFGVGSAVESIQNAELIEEGRKLFSGIGFKGIGSAEFKYDNRDGKLKLIELNPRYWQQNYLSTVCNMNFPYLNYLDISNQTPAPIESFQTGIKWVNRYMDFYSFATYRREGKLNFREWRKSLAGKKVYPDFAWDDPIPALYGIDFGRKLYKLPWALYKKLFRSSNHVRADVMDVERHSRA